MSRSKRLMNKLLLSIQYRAKRHGTQHYMFSVFAMLNYVTSLFFTESSINLNEILIVFRVVGVLLCFGLFFTHYWPVKWRINYFPIYWYVTLCFCLPFLASYTMFVTNWQEYWLLNMVLSLLFMIMLVDWTSFIILSIIGIVMSYILYLSMGYRPPMYLPVHDIYVFAYFCAFIFMAVIVFLRHNENNHERKLETMEIFGSAIAHEVNSPLATIKMLTTTLNDIVNIMKKRTKFHIKNKNNDDESIMQEVAFNDGDYKMLTDIIPRGYEKALKNAEKIIEILLVSLKDRFINQEQEYSIVDIIKEAVDDCRYSNPNEKDKITMNLDADIRFFGSKYMMKHIFYNLTRNAFKYGGEDVKINIWVNNADNTVHFRDNGAGITDQDIKKIFKAFYTKSKNHNNRSDIEISIGTGIGLSFCNIIMHSIGGSIKCKSEIGKYTEFILMFPY